MVQGLRRALPVLLLLASPVLAEAPPDLVALRQASLELTNEARLEAGLSALELDPTSNAAAQAHAEDMAQRGYYGHVSPDGRDPLDRYLSAGGPADHVVAENIARCDNCDLPADEQNVRRMHEGWLESPEHRRNLLLRGVSLYGFGIVQEEGGTILGVQLFAGAGAAPDPADTAALPEDPAAQSELAASHINEWRESGQPAIAVDRRLARAAAALLPESDLAGFEIDAIEPPDDLLTSQTGWSRLDLLGGSCGGCGARASEADIAFFLDQWKESPAYRRVLTDSAARAIGMTVAADGTGTKVALALIAGD